MNNRVRRFVIVGALTAAAAAAPAVISTATAGATPPCLATIRVQGQMDQCASYSNGQGGTIGTPQIIGGNGPDAGFYTGPLIPGTTISRGIG
jgi:hypothetical protein